MRRACWPEEFAAASAAHLFPKRHKHVRETIEILQGIWTNDLFEYHGEFADFERCGFGAKPVQKPCPPIYFSGLKDPKRSARRIAKYGLAGWIGIQDTPEEIVRWRSEIQRELDEIGSGRSLNEGFDMCSMIWFAITDEPTDQTPNGKLSNLLQRVIYHYWYHTGENAAIRQQLGHTRLPQFVGNIDTKAPYRPEQ